MINRFLLFYGCLLVGASTAFATEQCKKEQAQAAVEKVCKEIETSGQEAVKMVQKFRFCGTNYVWVQDKNVKMVIHPIKRRLTGKSLTSHKDENGKLLFVEFDQMARSSSKGGWVDYAWAKPGAEKATPKVSFVKLCGGDLGWVAGSGVWK